MKGKRSSPFGNIRDIKKYQEGTRKDKLKTTGPFSFNIMEHCGDVRGVSHTNETE